VFCFWRFVLVAGCLVVGASGRFDDQLLAGPVDVCCALQQVGPGDAEPTQGGLGRADTLTRVASDGWFGLGRVLRARAGIAVGVGGGPGCG